jgi:WD40 repeat protein
MARAAFLLILLATSSVAAADLPPGAVARLGDDRFRAGRAVAGLAFSPDGKQLLSWSVPANGLVTVALWEAETGALAREATLNSDLFCGAAWGPTGALVVVRRADGDPKGGRATLLPDDVRVWNVADLTTPPPPVFDRLRPTQRNPRWETDLIRPVGLREFREFAVSADGRRFAVLARSTDTKKYTAEVYELRPTGSIEQLKQVTSLALFEQPPNGLVLPPGGDHIITFDLDPPAHAKGQGCWLRVRNLHTGKRLQNFHLDSLPGETALSPDGQGLVHVTGGGVAIRDLATWNSITTLPHPDTGYFRPASGDLLAFSQDGKLLLQRLQRGARLVDVATGKELGRLDGHTRDISAFAVSADGTLVATADEIGLIRLWDAKSLRPVSKPEGHRAPVTAGEVSRDGKRLLTWARSDDAVCVWDLATGRLLRQFRTDLKIIWADDCPTFTPDGLSVILNAKGRLTAIDIQTGLESPLPGEMAQLPHGSATFAPDGSAVLTCSAMPDSITVWDWPAGKKRFAADPERKKSSWKGDVPRFSADGTAVFPAGQLPHRLDAKTGKELPPAWDLPRWPFEFASLRAFPPFGRPGEAGSIELFDADTGRAFRHLRCQRPESPAQNQFSDLALAPTGRLAAYGCDDGTVCLFEPATGGVRRLLTGHRGAARVLGFTPDGSKLLSAGDDQPVLIWDVRLANVPLPDRLKQETDAAKLWERLATGSAEDAYGAMARLAREPEAAVALVKHKLKPAEKGSSDPDKIDLAAARAIELLEALDDADARAFLKELAGGHADAFGTREAKRALERNRR